MKPGRVGHLEGLLVFDVRDVPCCHNGDERLRSTSCCKLRNLNVNI